MKLPFKTGMKLIYKAIEKDRDKKLWEMWLMRYQHMEKETFVPFSEFKKQHSQEVSKRPKEEILNEAYAIRKELGR
jgi:hypothetical protein